MKVGRVILPVMRLSAENQWLGKLLNPLFSPYNPYDPRRAENPSAVYEKVRTEGPMYYHRVLGRWIVTGYDEIVEVLRAETTADRSEIFENLPPWNKLKPETREMNTSSMLMVDPPTHTRLRALVNRAFTATSLKDFEPLIEAEAQRLLSEVDLAQPTELVDAFCYPLPLLVMSRLLGIPAAMLPEFDSAAKTIVKFVDEMGNFKAEIMDRDTERFCQLVLKVADLRKAEPADDLITKLVQVSEEDGDRLSSGELQSMCMLLLLAGFETSRNLIASSLVTLACHPEQRAALVADPSLIGNGVEELLRFESPVQATVRTAIKVMAIGDKIVKPGQNMLLLLGAGNRDPRQYENPNELQVGRPNPKPISFGSGIHFCVGAALARLETQIALRAFLGAYPNYQLDENRLQWSSSSTFRGPEELWVSA